eukprot:gene22029-26701_t
MMRLTRCDYTPMIDKALGNKSVKATTQIVDGTESAVGIAGVGAESSFVAKMVSFPEAQRLQVYVTSELTTVGNKKVAVELYADENMTSLLRSFTRDDLSSTRSHTVHTLRVSTVYVRVYREAKAKVIVTAESVPFENEYIFGKTFEGAKKKIQFLFSTDLVVKVDMEQTNLLDGDELVFYSDSNCTKEVFKYSNEAMDHLDAEYLHSKNGTIFVKLNMANEDDPEVAAQRRLRFTVSASYPSASCDQVYVSGI